MAEPTALILRVWRFFPDDQGFQDPPRRRCALAYFGGPAGVEGPAVRQALKGGFAVACGDGLAAPLDRLSPGRLWLGVRLKPREVTK